MKEKHGPVAQKRAEQQKKNIMGSCSNTWNVWYKVLRSLYRMDCDVNSRSRSNCSIHLMLSETITINAVGMMVVLQ